MRYDAVLFDLDGTLLNTLTDLTDSINAALAACGCPPRSQAEVRGFVGNGLHRLAERAVPAGAAPADVERVHAAMMAYYPAHSALATAPYPGVTELLRALRAAGCPAAVLSNKADGATRALCERYFPGLLGLARGERPGVPRKPAPDAVWAALRELGVAPERAAYVGDSEVDVQTARNAGVAGLFVSWGFRTRAELLAAGAGAVYAAPEALRAALLE